MEIRKFELRDREKVLQILRLNTPEYFSPSEENDLIHYFDFHADNYYVLENEHGLIGAGGFNISADRKTGNLSWGMVHPAYQGTGVGSKLMRYRIQRITEIDSVQVISVRTSQLVFKFYEKFGLELREVVKDYWAAGFDLYHMDCPAGRAH